jgi:hypothetical protein
MSNVSFLDVKDPYNDEIVQHAIIDHGDGSFTSMLKSTYDAQQAEQSTPIVINEAETI